MTTQDNAWCQCCWLLRYWLTDPYRSVSQLTYLFCRYIDFYYWRFLQIHVYAPLMLLIMMCIEWTFWVPQQFCFIVFCICIYMCEAILCFSKEASGPYSRLIMILIMLNTAWFDCCCCCRLVRIGASGGRQQMYQGGRGLPRPPQLVAPLSRGEPSQTHLAVVEAVVKTFWLRLPGDDPWPLHQTSLCFQLKLCLCRKIREKDIFKSLCVGHAVLLQLLTKALGFEV